MDRILYDSLSRYYNALEKTGYMSHDNSLKLLLLIFYRDFVYSDYRGLLTREDYCWIERALECLYGTTCLIPYPDYLKMGKLKLGDISELACRVKSLEDEKVLKLIHNIEEMTNDPHSDVIVRIEEEVEDNNEEEDNAEDTPIITDPSQIL